MNDNKKRFFFLLTYASFFSFSFSFLALGQQDLSSSSANLEILPAASEGIIEKSLQSGPVVFGVLLILIALSILSWAILVAKAFYLKKLDKNNQVFVKSFWDSRSLNDLNGRLQEFPYSPVREVFRLAYSELVRGSQLKEQAQVTEWAIQAAVQNLTRTLTKAKNLQKQEMEKFLFILAVTASVSPFIGLFGTVWGIMSSFDMIAKTGTTSLAAVAPGISEALIATAFGLAAAIPAVIGYNMASHKIRQLVFSLDGFGSDFLNIVERYLVTDKSKTQGSSQASTSHPFHSPRM